MGTLGTAIGELDRPEQLLLERVRGVLVKTLVGLPERREREADVLGRLCDGIEQLLPRLRVGDRHGTRLLTDRPGHTATL